MSCITVTTDKAIHYAPMFLAAGFCVVIVDALPDMWQPCEPDWFYIQMTQTELDETGWH